jgi:catechol 2,3-dioxygenase-like lactoylglutathione lyase family enzyme
MEVHKPVPFAQAIHGHGSEASMPLDIRGMCPLLEVFDMATSLKFYCDLLGFQIHAADQNTTRPDHNWVWLIRGGDIHLMLNTAYDPGKRPSMPDPRRVADHQDTCLYFGAPDVDAVYAYLQESGIESEEPHIAPYGMKQLYLRDPDGYGVCFQWQANQKEAPSVANA